MSLLLLFRPSAPAAPPAGGRRIVRLAGLVTYRHPAGLVTYRHPAGLVTYRHPAGLTTLRRSAVLQTFTRPASTSET